MNINWNKRKKLLVILSIVFLVLLVFIFSGPKELFTDTNYSTIVLSKDNELLSASISDDEQWYFPAVNNLPEKYKTAVIAFEDKRFYKHPGFDFLALMRAVKINLQAKRVISGASTITMQTIRLHRNNPPRTVFQKIVEICLAVRLEIFKSKDEILNLYANHAPFGGNVIGIEAASWRYFGKELQHISWAEASLLAVLPNSPGLIHTEKNRDKLLTKRNKLLQKLLDTESIDTFTYESAILEKIPRRAVQLPNLTPHLLVHLENQFGHDIYKTSIHKSIQQKCNTIAQTQGRFLKQNNINNLAILVLDLEDNSTLAYVGNLTGTGNNHQAYVDIIQSERSTGSLLKPFLYTAALQEGLILPKSFLPDYPIQMQGFQAENYNDKHSGLVNADEALKRSLNIPYAYLLQQYGIGKFIHLLQKSGINSVDRTSEYYGIPLILGGAECSLWELTNAYGFLGKTMNTYESENGYYSKNDLEQCSLLAKATIEKKQLQADPVVFRAENLWHTIQTIRQVKRPNEQGQWERFQSSRPLAWKTGTSNGFKDAWAIGFNKKYAVGIWVGNADGEGRPGNIGSVAAAPILFRVINSLPGHSWFQEPIDDLMPVKTCSVSGNLASQHCPVDSAFVSRNGQDLPICTYHKKVFLDASGKYEVYKDCYDMSLAYAKNTFTLPPKIAYYYQGTTYENKELHPDCRQLNQSKKIRIIYPENNIKIYQPKTGENTRNPFVLKAFHESDNGEIFWHMDETFYGTTTGIHELPILLNKGMHKLTIWDNNGNEDAILFEIVE